jgi:predicted dehydrogenase
VAPRAAVVGTGFGCRVQVPALRAAGFDVVALVGRDPARTERRAARAGVPVATTDLDAVLTAGVDAVAVATPPAWHAPVVRRCLAAGVHVLCEKPFAMDAAEARALRDEAAAAGVVALVGHEFRWSPERALAARALRAGAVGEPRLALLAAHVPLLREVSMPAWWFEPAAGGGWLGASGSHLVDQLRVWLGEVTGLSAALPVVGSYRGPAEDSFDVRVQVRSGASAVLQQTAASFGPAAAVARVVGTEGTLWIEGDAVWLGDRGGARVLPLPGDLRLPDPPDGAGAHRFGHLELGPYVRLCEAFRDAIAGRRDPREGDPRPATFDDGVACMAVLDAIRASAVAGGAWTPVAPALS